MSSTVPFQITLRRQPGYELLLSIRVEVKKRFAGVLTLSRPGWQDDAPTRSAEYRDVEASELRGGRFTLVHDGSERREGYSLARVTEQLLGRISSEEWTELRPVTEFGFRYLQVPEDALASTPAAAAVRTAAPGPPPTPVPVEPAPPSPAAGNRSNARGSLLSRARHSSSRLPPRAEPKPRGAPPRAASVSPPPELLSTTTGTTVRVTDAGEVEVRSSGALPPKPKPVAVASRSGTPAPSRTRNPHSNPPRGVMDTPVPADASLADLALASMGDGDVRSRLKAELARTQALQLRVRELERTLEDSLARERDLLQLLQSWQERMVR